MEFLRLTVTIYIMIILVLVLGLVLHLHCSRSTLIQVLSSKHNLNKDCIHNYYMMSTALNSVQTEMRPKTNNIID